MFGSNTQKVLAQSKFEWMILLGVIEEIIEKLF